MKTSTLLLVLTTAGGLALASAAQAGEEGAGRDARFQVDKALCQDAALAGDSLAGDSEVTRKLVKRAFLGVELTGLTPELRQHFGVPENEGVMIGRIVDDSAAFRSDLRVGDIVTRVDDQVIEGSWDLNRAIRDHRGGDAVSLEVWRDGNRLQPSVVLEEKETCSLDFSGLATRLGELGHVVMPEIQLEGLKISEEALEEVMESLRGIDWQEHLKKLEALQVENLDVRMEELQKHMALLGERLEREGARLGKDAERLSAEQMRELEEHHRVRLEKEVEARRELIEARQEALQDRAEALRAASEARTQATEAAHAEAAAARAEAQLEADKLRREAEEAAKSGGGVLF